MGYLTTSCANCGQGITWTERPGLDASPRWVHVDGETFEGLTLYVRCPASDPRTVAAPVALDSADYIYHHYDPEAPTAETVNDQGSHMPVQPPNQPTFAVGGLISVGDAPWTTTPPDAYEEIDRPDHYRIALRDGYSLDVIDVIDALGLNFHLGNALKCLVRAGRKPGVDAATDLRKAAYYATRLADKLEADDELF
jgi:hypothetical protein